MLEDTDNGQLEDIDVIPNEEMLLVHKKIILMKPNFLFWKYICLILSCIFQVLSEKGYVKRMKPNTFNLQNRGTIGKSIGKLRVNDAMSDFIVCHAHDHILYFRY